MRSLHTLLWTCPQSDTFKDCKITRNDSHDSLHLKFPLSWYNTLDEVYIHLRCCSSSLPTLQMCWTCCQLSSLPPYGIPSMIMAYLVKNFPLHRSIRKRDLSTSWNCFPDATIFRTASLWHLLKMWMANFLQHHERYRPADHWSFFLNNHTWVDLTLYLVQPSPFARTMTTELCFTAAFFIKFPPGKALVATHWSIFFGEVHVNRFTWINIHTWPNSVGISMAPMPLWMNE